MEDSKAIAFKVTAPYGPDYAAKLHKAFAGRWMDVLPRTGKASGAYMNGSAYDVHPYLHLNHNYDYESLSTFVHEWGHAVHTLLDNETQPYEKSNYSDLRRRDRLHRQRDAAQRLHGRARQNESGKAYYLGEGLELIRGTFFRQTMFGRVPARRA